MTNTTTTKLPLSDDLRAMRDLVDDLGGDAEIRPGQDERGRYQDDAMVIHTAADGRELRVWWDTADPQAPAWCYSHWTGRAVHDTCDTLESVDELRRALSRMG